MHKPALCSVALAAVFGATACIPSVPAEDRTAELPSEDTAEEAEPVDDADEAGEANDEVEIGGLYEFPDGLTVEMSDLRRGTSGEWAIPEAAPYIGWTLQFQNDTGSEVDTTLAGIECQIGDDGRRAEQIFDTDQGLGDGFTSTLMDGRNATADFACEVPEDETYLQVEVSILDELERPVIFFAGDVD